MKFLGFVLLFFSIGFIASGQQVSRVEYFIDTDPGYGNADSIIISPGDSLELDFTVPLGNVSNGLHTLYVRAQDSTGRWSMIGKTPFLRLEGEGGPQSIVQLEYFWDEDPGYGNGDDLSFAPGDSLVLDLTAPLGNVPTGLHTLYIRARDNFGRWSLLGKAPFLRLEGEGGPQRIVQLEYFWDEDPGYGNGVQIPLQTPMAAVLDTVVLADYSGLSEGEHSLVLRARDQLGRWSLLQSEAVIVPRVLAIGETNPDTIEAGESNYYVLQIPDSLDGASLRIRILSGAASGVNELYAEPGLLPARGQSTYKAEGGPAIERELFIWSAEPGPHFVLIYSEGTGTQPIQIPVEVLEFEILSVSPEKGGNTGNVTALAKGFRFEPDMEARLEKNGASVVAAETITMNQPGSLFATFNLSGVAEDNYDFVLQKTNGDTALWSEPFEVVTGEIIPGLIPASTAGGCSPGDIDDSAVLFVRIKGQVLGRANRQIPLTIFFENQGSIDIPVPRRILSNQRGQPLSFDMETLNEGQPQLLLELKEPGGPENILRAGASGRIRVYTRVLLGVNEYILLR